MGRILVVGGERSVIEKRIPLLLGYVVLVGFFVMRGFLFRIGDGGSLHESTKMRINRTQCIIMQVRS